MSLRAVVILVLAAVCTACTTQAGDSCTSNSSCGGSLTCNRCNPGGDSGVPDGAPVSTPTCVHPCTTHADCTGTSDVFGATPSCDPDLCGNHFCGA